MSCRRKGRMPSRMITNKYIKPIYDMTLYHKSPDIKSEYFMIAASNSKDFVI